MAGGVRGALRAYPEIHGLTASLICIAVFASLLYASPSLLEMIQQDIWDGFYPLAEFAVERVPDSRLVLIGVDEKSLGGRGEAPDLGTWRETILRVAERAKVVAIDCGFGEGEESSPVAHAPENVVFPLLGQIPKVVNSHYVAAFWKPMCLSNETNPSALFGHTNLVVDEDGVVRSVPPTVQVREDRRLALSLAAARLVVPGRIILEEGAQTRALVVDGRAVRLERGGAFRPYFLPSRSFRYYSFSDVASGKVRLGEFDGKVVVAGMNLEGRGAHYLSPREKRAPISGLFVQASAINALLTGSVFAEESRDLAIAVLVFLNLVMGYVFSRTRASVSAVAGFLGAVAYFSLAVLLFTRHYLLDTVYAPVSLSANFALTHLFLHASEALKRRQVEEIFGKYLKPEIVEMLVRSPEGALDSLRGIKKPISVLFCDIRGFTAFCESRDSTEVVDILNEMFEAVTTAVFSEEGTIDKFIGDAVMALFNAPQDQPDHADRAVRAGLKIVELTEAVAARRGADLRFGVGINTGEAVIGNIGSPKRLEYTAIGDSVNLASRLCSIAGPGEVLVSEATKRALLARYDIERVGEREVKGKRSHVMVYRVLREA